MKEVGKQRNEKEKSPISTPTSLATDHAGIIYTLTLTVETKQKYIHHCSSWLIFTLHIWYVISMDYRMSLLTNVQFYTSCQHVFFVEVKPRLPMVMNMGQILIRVPTDPEHCALIHSCFLRILVQRSIHFALGIYTGRLIYVHSILTGMIMARINRGLSPPLQTTGKSCD